jgi:hypothetical protein
VSHTHYDPAKGTDVEVTPQQCYEDFWRPALGLVPRLEDVQNELYDYHGIIKDLPVLYDTITGGLISKANTSIYEVIAAVEGREQEHIQQAIDDFIAGDRDKPVSLPKPEAKA